MVTNAGYIGTRMHAYMVGPHEVMGNSLSISRGATVIGQFAVDHLLLGRQLNIHVLFVPGTAERMRLCYISYMIHH